MNEVKKCSISGVGFTLDADAFEILDNYLGSLKKSYRENPDGDEIIADIEARIAELILSTQDTARVVERPLIENIIRQLGSAEEISDLDPDKDLRTETPRIPRRLYRDTENARLGGVCSGIGRYFDIDPVWVRMGLFAPLLLEVMSNIRLLRWLDPLGGNLFGIFLVCYFIMWFAVPAARTARQKLEMTGERITEQSIRETTAASGAADPDSKARPIVAETVSVLGKVVLICLKLFAGLIVFGLIMGACALIIGLFAVTVGGYEIFPIAFLEDFSLWIPVLGIVAVLIPVILLIYVMMCLIASRKPGGKTVLAVFLVWLATVIVLSALAVRGGLSSHFHRNRINIERIVDPEWQPGSDTEESDTAVDAEARRIRIGGADGAIDITVDPKNGKLRLQAGDDDATALVDVDTREGKLRIKAGDDKTPAGKAAPGTEQRDTTAHLR